MCIEVYHCYCTAIIRRDFGPDGRVGGLKTFQEIQKAVDMLPETVRLDIRNAGWSASLKSPLTNQYRKFSFDEPYSASEEYLGYNAGWNPQEPFMLYGPDEALYDPAPGDDFYWRQNPYLPGNGFGPGGSGGPGLIGKRALVEEDTTRDQPSQEVSGAQDLAESKTGQE
ncbi:hypothetical protein TWF506_002661 [Arthrobotrys conoides]|uniref:Uncharacterized protein n=1 Tax=Arthrobotrys conoides TaxID=74498 RepID=A0AAN8NFD7_9PEZI